MSNKSLIAVAVAVILAAAGGWYYWHLHHAVPPAPAAVTAPPAPAPTESERIEHPVPAAGPDAQQEPLPTLEESDGPLDAALAAAAGGTPITQYLVPDSLIRHIVVTVDNLPRQKVAVDKRPVMPAAGQFVADGDELRATLDTANFQRYTPLVSALQKVDMRRLAAVYLRFYPLFQKAYQDLGYPNGYFNDRLVQVIDLLLATPQVAEPIQLVRPNVMYVYADPALEARPAGQKLLIRMGRDNASTLKAKLKQLRALIVDAPKQ